MNRSFPHNSHGFSLIEVLVTLLLTSVGILGMAAMQAKGIAYTQDSIQRNTAAMLADDLMEIMRADRDRVIGVNGMPRATSGYYKDSGSFSGENNSECATLPNSPEDRLGCWVQHVSQTLPAADEFHIKAVDSSIEIQLTWQVAKGACIPDDADDADAESTTCQYTLRAEL